MFYSTYGTGKLRIARVTSTKNNLMNHCLILIYRIINQDLSKTFLYILKLLVSFLQHL